MAASKKIILGIVISFLTFATFSAQAQDYDSMTVGKATVTIGGGVRLLKLPDAPSMIKQVTNVGPYPILERFKFSDDFDEIGWNVNGSIGIPVKGMTLSLNGSWAYMDQNDGFTCSIGPAVGQAVILTPIVDNPAVTQVSGYAAAIQMISASTREVDQWSISPEIKWGLNSGFLGFLGFSRAPKSHYLAVGIDIRGIDQDLNANITAPAFFPNYRYTYSEELYTHYYGGYLAWGGNATPGFMERLGLFSSFRLQAGVYKADTDYDGRLVQVGATTLTADATSALELSDSETTFIGGLNIEIGKLFGERTTLSLTSGFDYYSYVPEMRYNDFDRRGGGAIFVSGPNNGTSIDNDDAFAISIGLNLKIILW